MKRSREGDRLECGRWREARVRDSGDESCAGSYAPMASLLPDVRSETWL